MVTHAHTNKTQKAHTRAPLLPRELDKASALAEQLMEAMGVLERPEKLCLRPLPGHLEDRLGRPQIVRHCLTFSHSGRETQGKGTVLAAMAVERQGKGSVLPTRPNRPTRPAIATKRPSSAGDHRQSTQSPPWKRGDRQGQAERRDERLVATYLTSSAQLRAATAAASLWTRTAPTAWTPPAATSNTPSACSCDTGDAAKQQCW